MGDAADEVRFHAFELALLGDVADDSRIRKTRAQPHGGHGDVHGEAFAVFPDALELTPNGSAGGMIDVADELFVAIGGPGRLARIDECSS